MILTISKGQQITIPAKMRKTLGLDVGRKLELIKTKEGIILKPISGNLDDLFRKAKGIKPKHDLTAKQMDEYNEKIFR